MICKTEKIIGVILGSRGTGGIPGLDGPQGQKGIEILLNFSITKGHFF